MARLVRIDGGSNEPIHQLMVNPGETIGQVANRLGVTITETPLPDLPHDLVHQAEVNEEVAQLLREHADVDNLPAVQHGPDDPCVTCDAIRIAEDLLG